MSVIPISSFSKVILSEWKCITSYCMPWLQCIHFFQNNQSYKWNKLCINYPIIEFCFGKGWKQPFRGYETTKKPWMNDPTGHYNLWHLLIGHPIKSNPCGGVLFCIVCIFPLCICGFFKYLRFLPHSKNMHSDAIGDSKLTQRLSD